MNEEASIIIASAWATSGKRRNRKTQTKSSSVRVWGCTRSAARQSWEKLEPQMLSNTTSFVVLADMRIPTALALAGTGRLGQIPCDGDCGIMLCTVRVGRASQLSSFREFLLVGNKISCTGQIMNPSRGKRRCTYLLDMSHFHCPWVQVVQRKLHSFLRKSYTYRCQGI